MIVPLLVLPVTVVTALVDTGDVTDNAVWDRPIVAGAVTATEGIVGG